LLLKLQALASELCLVGPPAAMDAKFTVSSM
jgi:hypothetical protein